MLVITLKVTAAFHAARNFSSRRPKQEGKDKRASAHTADSNAKEIPPHA